MLVAANKQLYVTLPKRQKMLLSMSIVNAVRAQNPPGRFLQKDAKSDNWYDVGDQRAQEKTSQALREGAPEIRKDGQTDRTNSAPPFTLSSASESATAPTVVSSMPVATALNITAAYGSNIQQMPPPGSHPVLVTYQTPNGPQTIPMYPAMMVPGTDGTMVSAMPLIMQQQQRQYQTSCPPNPSCGKTPGLDAYCIATNVMNTTIPPPAISPTPSAVIMPPPSKTGAFQSSMTHLQEEEEHQCIKDYESVASELDAPGMVDGGLEPAGLSMGTIEFVGNGKLEPVGLSFGSVMSFSVASKGPDMVDGGLEPIGTSFGSLSLNSTDDRNLEHALGHSSFNRPSQKASLTPDNANTTYSTPMLFSEQRSKGNLLECSDTESDDDDEIPAALQANKTAEWEKLQAMLSQQTMVQSKNQHMSFPMPTNRIQLPPEGLPTTTFEHNFSELSAMSMGNDFSPDVQISRKQFQVPDFSYNSNNNKTAEWEKLQAMLSQQATFQSKNQHNSFQMPTDSIHLPPEGLPTTTFEHNFSELSAMSMGNDFSPDVQISRKQFQVPDFSYNSNNNNKSDHLEAHVSPYSDSMAKNQGPAHSNYTPAYNNVAHEDPDLCQRHNDDSFDDAPPPVVLTKANENDAETLEIMFLSRGGSLAFDEFEGQSEQV